MSPALDAMYAAIEKEFSGAVAIPALVEQIEKEVGKLGYELQQAKPAISSCRDDTTAELEHALHAKGFLNAFHLHTLTGLPVSGKASIAAYYHHIPKQGVGIIIYAPHLGVDAEGRIGSVNRHGIAHPSASCGAVHALLAHFKEGEENHIPGERELSDVAASFSREEVLHAEQPFLYIAETLYTKGMRMLQEQMHSVQEENKKEGDNEHPVLLFGGIHIDTHHKVDNKFQIREIVLLRNGEAELMGEKR